MRVGIYWGDSGPHAGGGYTFETTLLKVLMQESSPHQFYFFGYSFPSVAAIPEHIHFIPMKKWKNYTFRKIIEVANRKLFHFSSKRVAEDLYYRNDFRNQLNQLVQKHEVDIVWFVGPHFVPVECAYIFTVWDLAHREYPFFPEVSYGGEWARREILYRAALNRATFILTGTDAGKEEILRYYRVHPQRIKKAPFFVPSWISEVESQLDVSSSERLLKLMPFRGQFLFYPAQFWAHKNHLMLLRVLKVLKERYQEKVILVLTGSDKGFLSTIKKNAQELGVDDQIHYLGFVSYDELRWLYQNANALVFPTFFGPDNIPPLEAFALGCPVVASNVSGAQEQLGEAALLFELNDEQQLINHILSLRSDSELRSTLQIRGKKKAEQQTVVNYLHTVFEALNGFAGSVKALRF